MRAITTRSFNIIYPIFDVHFFVFKKFFQNIMTLCKVSF